MNVTILIGRLTKDPDLRYTTNGKAVTTFTLAVDKQKKDDGADFFPIVVWDKAAEAVANYTKKGSKVAVTGRLSTRNYDNKEGQKVYVTEVVANSYGGVEFLDNKQSGNTQNNQQGQFQGSNNQPGNFQNNNTQQPEFNNNGNFGGQNFSNSNTNFGGSTLDITDADLPF